MALNPGATIGPFRVLSLLGKGGMGEVFAATDSRLDRKVAIKALLPEFGGQADLLRRFEQEAKTLAALNHPNILTIYDMGLHDGAPYLVSELMEGETLRSKLKQGPV